MKSPLHQGGPPPDRYNLTVENKSGEEAPAYGILRVTNGKMPSEDGSYEIGKPDGSSATYWINSPVAIADDAFGAATNRFPTTVAYDDAETPAVGEEWGPVTGSWLLTKTGTGYRIVGTPEDGLVRVEKIGGGGGSSTPLSEARVTVDVPAQTLNEAGDGWAIPDTPGRAILVDSDGHDIGEDFAVTNRDDQFYELNCRVWLDGLRVAYGSCDPIVWPTEPEEDP